MTYLYASGESAPDIERAPHWARLFGMTEEAFLALLADDARLRRNRKLKHSQQS